MLTLMTVSAVLMIRNKILFLEWFRPVEKSDDDFIVDKLFLRVKENTGNKIHIFLFVVKRDKQSGKVLQYNRYVWSDKWILTRRKKPYTRESFQKNEFKHIKNKSIKVVF